MKQEFRIFGPPGTGKTTYLSRQIEKATEKYGPHSIVVSSFTRAAAKELAGRDLPIPEEMIGTLHAHCFHFLELPRIAETQIKQFNEMYPDFALSSARADVTESALDQTFETQSDVLLSQYNILRNKLVPKKLWPPSVLMFSEKWDKFKFMQGCLDFTDIIEECTYTMEHPPGGATIGIFDEVQDFTPLQLKLVRKWGESLDFFLLAGDDDQTLYSFAGATPDAFLKPEIDASRKKILNQSYRVPRAVQAFAQRIVTRIQKRQQKEYKPRKEEGSVNRLHSSYKSPQAIVSDALNEVEEGRTVMILGSCAYMLSPTIAAMREEGVPFWNPYKTSRGDWNPLTPGSGIPMKQRILDFLQPNGPKYGQYRLWSLEQLIRWIDAVKVSGILKRGGKDKIMGYKGKGELPVDQYFKLLTCTFEPQGLNEAIELKLEWFMSRIAASRLKSAAYPAKIIAKHGIDTVTKTPSVTIGTIHSVKGGQADTVYLFPDISVQAVKGYRTSREDYDSIMRQFYVGATRAKLNLKITNPAAPGLFVQEVLQI